MAGGIFVDRPFMLNAKCILFSLYSSMIYIAAGGSNILLIALIFIVSYVLLAWYDYAYDCNNYMFSGTGIGPSGIFKPQRRDEDGLNLVEDQESAYLTKVYYFHALIIAPLMIYAGFSKNVHPYVLPNIGGLGVLALMYHGYRIKVPRQTS